MPATTAGLSTMARAICPHPDGTVPRSRMIMRRRLLRCIRRFSALGRLVPAASLRSGVRRPGMCPAFHRSRGCCHAIDLPAQLVDADAVDEVAESLIGISVTYPDGEDVAQDVADLTLAHARCVLLVETGAGCVSAEQEL